MPRTVRTEAADSFQGRALDHHIATRFARQNRSRMNSLIRNLSIAPTNAKGFERATKRYAREIDKLVCWSTFRSNP